MIIVGKWVNIFLPGAFLAINICGIVFAKRPLNDTQKNHELIHSKQIWELMIIGFYLIYIIDFIRRLITYGTKNNTAYKNICFEREAYANESNADYLKYRKFWAWKKYYFTK